MRAKIAAMVLVVDTDGGIDDAVALWWALSQPDVEVAAIVVTWGNADGATAAANVCRVLHAAGRPDVPVVLGAAGPIGPTPYEGFAAPVHGTDGLGGTAARWPTGGIEPMDAPPVEVLGRLTDERSGEVDVVTIGPLSSLAGALRAEPGLAAQVRSLTVMGGAVRRPGNALPLGEANITHDPSAAAIVVGADWVSAPLLVGLDATLRALLDTRDLDLADEGHTPAARFLAEPLRAYAGFYAGNGETPPGTFPCHDLLAVLAAVDPSIVTEAPTVPLAVDTGGSAAWGTTVADLRPSERLTLPGFTPWRVALTADAGRLRTAFHSLVAPPAGSGAW